ncbi:MAG: hypothetical protein O3A51_07375, partial [Verrucomicrobia bacterium]|nr:hypothetical protein [Verrucomicrobiota bacterium]
PLYYRKGKQARKAGEAGLFAKIIGNSMWMLLYLFVYSAVMLLMRQGTGKLGYNTFEYSGLILIPVIFQTLHYYAEMFIWRFSNTHIRQEIGMYLLSDSANTPRAGRS